MKGKLFSVALIGITMLSLSINLAVAFQKSNTINDINSYNNVEKLDDNNCLIHCGNIFSKSDLLITKEANLDKFDYKIFDNNSKDEIYSLSTTQNINFSNGKIYGNTNPCAVVWAVIDSVQNGTNLANSLANTCGSFIAGQVMSYIKPILEDIPAMIAQEGLWMGMAYVAGTLSTPQVLAIIAGTVSIA